MTTSLASLNLAVIRAAGRAHVLARLESLVNQGMIGVAGAQKVYRDAFGGHVIAVKDMRPEARR